MKKFWSKWDYVIWLLFGSAVAIWMRARCLISGYDASGLPIQGFHSAYALIGMTAVVFFGAVLLSRKLYGAYNTCDFEQLFCGMSRARAAVSTLCGAAIIVASIAGLATISMQIEEQSNEYQQLGIVVIVLLGVMWVLGLLSGIGLLLLSRRQASEVALTKGQAIWLTFPMLWFALDLIMVYHENSGNPVLSDYSYMLLLIIAIMTAFHSMAGFLFSPKPSAVRFFASAGIVIYLTCVQAGGLLFAVLFGYDRSGILLGDMIRTFVYLVIGVYMLIQLIHVMSRVQKLPEKAK